MTASGSGADEKYSVYSRSLWENSLDESERNRLIWLEAQEDELPGGSLGKKYRDHIRFLKAVAAPLDSGEREAELYTGTAALEKNLLNRRFAWKGGPGGRFSYRELTAGLREDPGNRNYARALMEEAFMLADSGMAELIALRNRLARVSGYNDYWEMVNGRSGGGITGFLEKLEEHLSVYSPEKNERPDAAGKRKGEESVDKISLEEAAVFFCSVLFPEGGIPDIDLVTQTGGNCPPGSAAVFPLRYCSEKKPGHGIGLRFPFAEQGVLDSRYLGALFHELTHLFHFAFIDGRGGYAFPSELASGNLIYEIEALCFQNLVSSVWNKEPLTPDYRALKDLVYIARTERLLYSERIDDSKDLKDFIEQRIRKVYPRGGFIRTPLGASVMISGTNSGMFWEYPAAYLQGMKKAVKIAESPDSGILPESWTAGNEISWTDQPEAAFKFSAESPEDLNEFFSPVEFTPGMGKPEDVYKEMTEAGIRFTAD